MVNKCYQAAVAGGQSWTHFRNNVALAAALNLGRDLLLFERELFWFPRVCRVCKCSDPASIASCPACHSVFYCSGRHMQDDRVEHQKYCRNYLLLLECDSLEAVTGIQDIAIPCEVDSTYKKLPDKLISLLRSENPDPRHVTLLTERLSYPLSLLYALEIVGVRGKPVCEASSLCVHVVGAQPMTELLGLIRWEYMVHRLPRLRKLRIAFIGPEVFKDGSVTEEEDSASFGGYVVDDTGITMCDVCQKDERKIIYEMSDKCYHDFVASGDYSSPDIIIAFNCGFHEQNDDYENGWAKTFPFLVADMNVPLVFTSYTEKEASRDLEVLNAAVPVSTVVKSRLNPYGSLRPYRDHEADNDVPPVYFWNNFITCVAKESL